MTIAHGLYWMGLLQLWQRIALRRKVVVLMYHRVLTEEEQRHTTSHPGIVVSLDTFAAQMALLKRRFVILSVEEFADRIERNLPFPDSSCLITFDDGWRDNYTNALPVLERHQLPALVFLPVNYIGRQRLFWQETLTHLLVRAVCLAKADSAGQTRVRALLAPLGLERALDLEDEDPRAAIAEIVGGQKSAAPAAVDALIAALANALDLRVEDIAGPSNIDGFLRWEEALSMGRRGITFGGHGAEHRLLTHVPDPEARQEIAASRQAIREKFPDVVPTFSYPNGNWNPQVAAIVKEQGYRLAFTTEPGPVRSGDDPFSLRRINVHEDATRTAPMFLAHLVGLF